MRLPPRRSLDEAWRTLRQSTARSGGIGAGNLHRQCIELVLSRAYLATPAPSPEGNRPAVARRVDGHITDIWIKQLTEARASSEAGLHFRNDIVTGPGGSQILLEVPSGNLIEFLQQA